MSSNPIALIEIGGSHAECLLSQMHAIKENGYKIILVCTIDIKTRNPIFKEYVDEFYIVDLSHSRIKNRNEIKNIWKKIKTSGVEKVIFNTAQGNHVRNLCLYALFNKIEFIGIIHTTLKFKNSLTQKIINWKIKKYLLLSEHLLSTITPPKGIKVDYFYPIRYPHFNKPLKKDRPIVTIVGGVENRRRDLTGFAKILIASKDIDISFVFLGQTNQYNEEVIAFRQIVNKYNLMDRILSFDDYVSQEVFDTYLRNTDLVLPLVHPNTASANQYFKNQISGAMSIAFGYKIPMLIHEEYKHIVEMNDASFYYNESTFPEVLLTSLENRDKKSAEIHANSFYDVKKQEERYSQFIFSHSKHLPSSQLNISDNTSNDRNADYDVAIILINYNSSKHTAACINSIKSTVPNNISYGIIVIDNASEIDDYNNLKGVITTAGDHIQCYRSKINLGFSAGNMFGIQNIDANYYFLLNNDCILQNDCIGILHRFCEENPIVALCSPQLINKNGEPQPCINYFPTLKTKVFGSGVLNLSQGEKHTGRKKVHENPIRVDVVSGSQMFVRAEYFFKIGGLDTTFFLYCEEEDLALRLHNAGYKTYLVPDARNYHLGSASTKKSLGIKKEFYISFLYFYRKHYGPTNTFLIKIILCIRLLRKSLKDKDNLSLAFFIMRGAHLKHSLRHKQEVVRVTTG